MENSVLSYRLFLSSLAEGRRFKKLVKIYRFLPLTLETKKIGMTSSDEVMR